MKNKEIVPPDYCAEVSDFYDQLAENCASILGRVVSRHESKSITYSLAFSAPTSFIADMLGTTNEKAGKVCEEIFKLQENLYTKIDTLQEQERQQQVGEH